MNKHDKSVDITNNASNGCYLDCANNHIDILNY
jgi:hypothetical protein